MLDGTKPSALLASEIACVIVAEYLLVLFLVRCDYFSIGGIGPWHMLFER